MLPQDGIALDITLWKWLCENLAEAACILEFGSGRGTTALTTRWQVTSVEHDEKWVGVAPDSEYIHAPIVENWYDHNKLQDLNRQEWDLILIDGPTLAIGRENLIPWAKKHPEVFSTLVVVDDHTLKGPKQIVSYFLQQGKQVVYENAGSHPWVVLK